MQAMAFFDTLAVLVSLLVFFTAGTFAQGLEHVTLWQFGKGRLLPGHVTLPMQPLGTLGDGSATTYLYQVVNDVTITTTNSAGFTTQTIPDASSRTIVASASGWVEQFGGDQIACGLVNSGFGECLDTHGGSTVLANSGKPTPQTVLIATPMSVTTPPPTSSSVALPKKSSGGAIAGGVVAGCLVLLVGLAVCVLFRRRRRRQQQEFENKFAARGYDPKPNNINSNATGTEKPNPFAVFTAGPQVESALDGRPTRHKRDYSASTQSQSSGGSMSHSRVTSASDLPTSDLVRILAERTQIDASEAPPAYPATPHFRPREKN
ncbi:hypothetical protein MVEN_02395700 [Mycena venus]|uniref:Uncharacterized protein n=1 Tax=Mycena venus TaxID=2733690 RepID=A0A8H6X2B6_9AGAR|nr:hypothetical protein MVEN_02395700 [Mycena venus]